jgi:thioredoxin reductase
METNFDVLIIGGSVAGVSCALVLGSALKKPFMTGKKIGIVLHQKTSALQEAVFYNAYGILPGKMGKEIMHESIVHLTETYPSINQINGEKVIEVLGEYPQFTVKTNKNSYTTKQIVVATGNADTFNIEGLNTYVIPHKKRIEGKTWIQLENIDHKVAEGIYVAGTLSGHRSQLTIAAGSGASVATDLLVFWNNGNETHSHDSLK